MYFSVNCKKIKFSKKKSKKLLQNKKSYVIIVLLFSMHKDICAYMKLLKGSSVNASTAKTVIFSLSQGGATKWQSAKYAARVLHSDTMYPIPTERQTELGSPTSEELRQLLVTANTRQFTFALVVSDPAR